MAANRTEVLANGVYSANGVTAAVKVSTATMLMVGIDLTAKSGTLVLNVILQGSDDGGTTWFDIPCDQALITGGTVVTNHRCANGSTALSSNAQQACGIYKHLPTDTVRVSYEISGTTPTATMSISVVTK